MKKIEDPFFIFPLDFKKIRQKLLNFEQAMVEWAQRLALQRSRTLL